MVLACIKGVTFDTHVPLLFLAGEGETKEQLQDVEDQDVS